MTDEERINPPHGGYENLKSYQMAEIVYDATVRFCEQYLDKRSRTDFIFVRPDRSVTSAVLGDGGIYSSVNDLFKWDQALFTTRLVSPSLLQQTFTQALLNNGSHTTYGFGWYVNSYKGVPCVYHTGSTRGFRNAILRFPDLRLTVILLTNRNEGEPIQIVRKIAEQFMVQNKQYDFAVDKDSHSLPSGGLHDHEADLAPGLSFLLGSISYRL
jgi:CubicO group peptidase (beta-lactamase class C family)